MPCSQIKTLIWCCIMKKQQFEGLILLIIQYKHAVEYKTTKWWPQKSWINISLITLLKAAVYVVATTWIKPASLWILTPLSGQISRHGSVRGQSFVPVSGSSREAFSISEKFAKCFPLVLVYFTDNSMFEAPRNTTEIQSNLVKLWMMWLFHLMTTYMTYMYMGHVKQCLW